MGNFNVKNSIIVEDGINVPQISLIYGTNGASITAFVTDIVFTGPGGTTQRNDGGNYNTSNGRYTAPANVVLCFQGSIYATSTNILRVDVHINGAVANTNAASDGNAVSQRLFAGAVKVNAGDYVTFRNQGGFVLYSTTQYNQVCFQFYKDI